MDQYSRGSEEDKSAIYSLYLANTQFINNWDLVDSSAHKIVGHYLEQRDRAAEETFLEKHYRVMPRTMLRYAIEKFDSERRQAFLKGKV